VDEPMILLNVYDPANPFPSIFPLTNEVGEVIKFMKTPHKYMIIQAGQPILLYEYQRAITVLADLSKERAEEAIRTLMQIIDNPPKVETYKEIGIRDWNAHPIDVSPARHLLLKLGFVESGSMRKGLVYEGTYKPDEGTITQAEEEMPEIFERAGKEAAPVKYDAEWTISRSPGGIRDKVRELIETLEGILPKECEFVYHPRNFNVHYRGVGCISPHIQQKQIWLRISHAGWGSWYPGILINSETNLNSPEFISEFLEQFEKSRQHIDSQLEEP